MDSSGLGEFLCYFLLICMNADIFVTLATLVVFYIPKSSQQKNAIERPQKWACWEYWI